MNRVKLYSLLENLSNRVKAQADWHEQESRYLRKVNAELRREIKRELKRKD